MYEEPLNLLNLGLGHISITAIKAADLHVCIAPRV